MFSFIVCSIHPQRAEALRRNLEATVGVPFELIVKDNRGTGKGICRVYNEAAAEARFDLVGFLHEDIAFRTPDWGGIIAAQLRQPGCGAIGFAGSSVKSRALSGWAVRPGVCENYTQPDRKHPEVVHRFRTENEPRDFVPAVCLDGLCLFVRREVWSEIRFDERTFRGFHAYDLDFTTAVARRYRNYVCMNVLVEHFSTGAYSHSWVRETMLYHDKWRDSLPMFAGEPLSPRETERMERRTEGYALRFLLRHALITREEARRMVPPYLARYRWHFRTWQLWVHYRAHLNALPENETAWKK